MNRLHQPGLRRRDALLLGLLLGFSRGRRGELRPGEDVTRPVRRRPGDRRAPGLGRGRHRCARALAPASPPRPRSPRRRRPRSMRRTKRSSFDRLRARPARRSHGAAEALHAAPTARTRRDRHQPGAHGLAVHGRSGFRRGLRPVAGRRKPNRPDTGSHAAAAPCDASAPRACPAAGSCSTAASRSRPSCRTRPSTSSSVAVAARSGLEEGEGGRGERTTSQVGCRATRSARRR